MMRLYSYSIKISKQVLLLLAICFFSTVLMAQADATVDATFNVADHGYMHWGSGTPSAILMQPDQNVLVAAVMIEDTIEVNNSHADVVRYLPDGRTDGSFKTAATFGDGATIRNLALGSGGKIYVAGISQYYGIPHTNGVIRFDSNKTLDNTFDPGTGPQSPGFSYLVKEMPDGRVLCGGDFHVFSGVQRHCLIVLHNDGSVDTTFNAGLPAVTTQLNAMEVQTDGKIIIGSRYDSLYTSPWVYHHIARLLGNGGLDTSFNTGSGANGPVFNLLLQPDGKVIVRGTFTVFNGDTVNGIVRLNTNGSIDTAFKVTIPFANKTDISYSGEFASALSPDGSFYINGIFHVNGRIMSVQRFFSNGEADTNFRFSAYQATDTPAQFTALAVQADGKLVGGAYTNDGYMNGRPRNGIARFMLNGDVDTTFMKLTGANGLIRDMARQADGRMLAVGDFTGYNDWHNAHVMRFFADGTADTSFKSPFVQYYITTSQYVQAVALQPDDKILIAGDSFNLPQKLHMCRLNTDGSPDNTFTPADGTTNGPIHAILLQPDGKIVLGGSFTIYNGMSRSHIVRLNADGTIDNTFYFHITGLTGLVNSMALQPDGKIVAGGEFGVPLMRLNTDGSLDASFATSVQDITKLIVLPDSQIVFTGNFTEGLRRMHFNGTLDTVFENNSGGGFTSNYNADIAVQSDGKYLVSGDFTVFGIYNGIARFLPNNAIDPSFYSNPGAAYGSVYKALVLPDNNVMLGGAFSSFNNTGKNCLARVRVTITPQFDIVPVSSLSICAGKTFYQPFITAYVFNPDNVFTVELSDATGSFATPTVIGSLTGVASDSVPVTIPVGTISSQLYQMRVVSSDPVEYSTTTVVNITQASTDTLYETICHGNSYSFYNANVNQQGLYTDTVTSAGGCKNLVTLNLTVLSLVPALVQSNDSLSTDSFASYQWIFNGEGIPGAHGRLYVAGQTGVYSVAVTDSNGCSDTSAGHVVVIGGIPSTGAPAFGLYPNPSHGLVTIETGLPGAEVFVYNISGQLITKAITANGIVTLNDRDYSPGVYTVTLQHGEFMAHLKMIRE